jgi:hypothetical protein
MQREWSCYDHSELWYPFRKFICICKNYGAMTLCKAPCYMLGTQWWGPLRMWLKSEGQQKGQSVLWRGRWVQGVSLGEGMGVKEGLDSAPELSPDVFSISLTQDSLFAAAYHWPASAQPTTQQRTCSCSWGPSDDTPGHPGVSCARVFAGPAWVWHLVQRWFPHSCS